GLAAVAAGRRAGHGEPQRAAGGAADGALRRVLDGPAGPRQTADPEIAAALRRCGLPRRGPLVVVAVTAAPAGPRPGTSPDAAGPPAGGAGPPGARGRLGGRMPAPPGPGARAQARGLAPGGAGGGGPVRARARARGGGAAGRGAGGAGPGAGGGAPRDRPARGGPGRALGASVRTGGEGGDEPHATTGRPPAGHGTDWTAAGVAAALAQARQARRLAALLGEI